MGAHQASAHGREHGYDAVNGHRQRRVCVWCPVAPTGAAGPMNPRLDLAPISTDSAEQWGVGKRGSSDADEALNCCVAHQPGCSGLKPFNDDAGMRQTSSIGFARQLCWQPPLVGGRTSDSALVAGAASALGSLKTANDSERCATNVTHGETSPSPTSSTRERRLCQILTPSTTTCRKRKTPGWNNTGRRDRGWAVDGQNQQGLVNPKRLES